MSSEKPQADAHDVGATQAAKSSGGPSVDLLNDPLWKALLFMALPTTIGFVFNTLYNVVDLIYARSWVGPEGASTQDALGATVPLFFLQLAFGIGLYQGATALISNAFGRGDRAAVRKIAIQCLTFGLMVGAGVMVLGLAVIYPVLVTAQGLGPVEFDWAAGYMIVIFLGAPLIIANFALYALLSGAGNNRAFGVSLTVAFFLNIALNYLMMHIFGWGIVGLGVATVLIQGPLNFLYVAYETRLLGTLKGVRLADFAPDWPTLRLIAAQAFPASLSMLIVAISILILNGFAGQYADGTLGGISAGARIEQVVLLPIIGVGIGALAIIGQNYGAGNIERVKQTFSLTTKTILVLTLISTALLILFRTPLSNLVATPGREAEVSAIYLIYAAVSAIPFGLLYIATSFKTGMRQPLFAAAINAMRLIVLPLVLIPLFQVFDPTYTAVAKGTMVSGLVMGVLAYIWVARSVRTLT